MTTVALWVGWLVLGLLVVVGFLVSLFVGSLTVWCVVASIARRVLKRDA